MKLVADRFVVMDDQRAVDLSSGEEIMLMASTAGGPSEQTRWTLRCDRQRARSHHVSLPETVSDRDSRHPFLMTEAIQSLY